MVGTIARNGSGLHGAGGTRRSLHHVHDDRLLVERRIERELWQRVLPHVHTSITPMRVSSWDAPGEPVPFAEPVRQRFQPFALGTAWSRPWGTTWFRLDVEVPEEWVGPQLEAIVDLGFAMRGAGFQAEGLVRTADGQPLQGVHPRRTSVTLHDVAPGPLTLFVEAASNPNLGVGFQPTPMGSLDTAPQLPIYKFRRADLAVRDDDVLALVLDLEVLQQLMLALPLTDPRRARVRRTLADALDAIDVDRVAATATAARDVLRPALELPARASSLHVVAVGHAHIDSAWLWPIRETVRKCTRTFASAVRLMDEQPAYRFVCSQAAQYAWMEQHEPALFARIGEKVATGQFVPVGGMWVEADMNLPSGESIARQLIHGQRWFEDRFGLRCGEVWIPDVFGYPASLPQVFAAGGCDRFVTQKLSWNKQNRFPHHTFRWEGLDGTRVLTHFPPVDTYNAEIDAREIVASEANFREHAWSDRSLMPYGYGNGGGGPTREMVERALRMADLDGSPRVSLGTPSDFFDAVEAEIANGGPVPVWRGELYFEMHRGTLTSQIRTKVGNLRCERLLREVELWWAAGGTVPAEVAGELDALWKDVLLQQFHDIIPGSSIAWVHADAEATHERVALRLEELRSTALARLGRGAAVANAATHRRREVVEVAAGAGTPWAGGPTQLLASGAVAGMVEVDGSAIAALAAEEPGDHVVTTEHSMANSRTVVRWDLDGTVVSIIDVREGRELLPPGGRIELELAPDHPVEYDAWDLESWTPAQGRPIGGVTDVQLVDGGPLVARLVVRHRFGASGGSMATVAYVLRAGSPRLDIELDVDWHEHEQLLSLRVPLDVHAAEARCGIQLGHVGRPTHPSSPWDAAKFEVCAHRWVDVSEPSFGVAVLNDGRWGHGLFDGGVRVSLLRGARFPDPEADQGRHRMRLAILPHGPGLHDVIAHGEALAHPLTASNIGRQVPSSDISRPMLDGVGVGPVVAIDHPGVLATAVKRADDGSDDLIVRCHEAVGDRADTTFRLPAPITAAWRCDLLEAPGESLDTADGIVRVVLRPFELVTLRLRAG